VAREARTRRPGAGSKRERSTGYGSDCLAKASDCAGALRHAGARTPLGLMRALALLPYLLVLLCAVPRTRLRLSSSSSGDLIRSHLRLRHWGLPRFRLAQGVLHLPPSYTTYLRGRSKQAVRTNVARAKARGIESSYTIAPEWTPLENPRARAAPAQHWQARNRAGVIVGEAWMTVDEDCALLHSLVTKETDVRWLLHTAIVEQLCSRGCRQLLTDSYDAFLMPAGQQYFQRLLGYSVERLYLHPSFSPRMVGVSRALALLVTLVAAAAVGEQSLASIL
jgi:hypothetical protein